MKLGTTLTRFLIEQKSKVPQVDDALVSLLGDIAVACKLIAGAVSKGALGQFLGDVGQVNIQGETQKKLDVLSNQILLDCAQQCDHLAGVASEEMEEFFPITSPSTKGEYLLVFDPLDGSSNIDVNISVGTIFSILRSPKPAAQITEADFLQPGTAQVCAGYALYGPSTMMVLTVGSGVHGFTFDREEGEFILTHPDMSVKPDTREFAINTSNQRFWEEPVQRYIGEMLAGEEGPRGTNFNMRWVASMVAEVHRILARGGIFMYPKDTKDPSKPGRLRLMYEANPMSFIIEQAGGISSTGRERILEIKPGSLHQRVPVILGSKNEVERVVRYHAEPPQEKFSSPLFNVRSVFRQ